MAEKTAYSTHSTKKLQNYYSYLIIAAVVLILLVIFFPQLQKQLALKPKIAPTPTASYRQQFQAPAPLAQGKQTYNISRGSGSKGPDIRQVIFDPLDAKPGQNQTISVKVQNKSSVKSVSVTLKTDNKTKTYDLKLKDGTDLNGIWEGSWSAEDTHDFEYRAIVESADGIDKFKTELTLR